MKKARQRFEREVTRAGERVVRSGLPAVGRGLAKVQEAAPSIPHKVFVAAMGVAAFKATQAVMDAVAEGKTDMGYIAALAFRRARVALQQQLGRTVNRDGMRMLKEKIASAVMLNRVIAQTAPFGVGQLADLIRRAF